MLNAVRFRPLPFLDPGRLVMMLEANPVQGGRRAPTFGTFQAWKAQSHSFESMGITGAASELDLPRTDGAERIPIDGFDVGLQSVLNVKPILGRRLSRRIRP